MFSSLSIEKCQDLLNLLMWFGNELKVFNCKSMYPGLTKMCKHASYQTWFHGNHGKIADVILCEDNALSRHGSTYGREFFVIGDFKLDAFDCFIRADEK